jgi:hypothetical protein
MAPLRFATAEPRLNVSVSANREMRRSAMLSDFERQLCGKDLR